MTSDVIWAYGFDGDQQQVEEEVAAIGPTAFDVVILPFLHVHADGSLYYNDTPLDSVWCGLANALGKLKADFPVQKRLLMSIGPMQADFEAFVANIGTVLLELLEFTAKHHIDGIDLDYEGDYETPYLELLAKLVSAYRAAAPDDLVTAAPYEQPEFWAGAGGLLSRTATSGLTGNLIDWFNVQFYMGSENIAPDAYPQTFETWATAVAAPGNGVPDGPDFIVPGCNGTKSADGFGPGDVARGLQAIRRQHQSIGGGFVWNYQELNGSVGEWGQAIQAALGGG
jgi:hypothetical protein